MTNESNPSSQGSPFGTVGRFIVGFLVLSLAGALLATWFVNRYVVFAVERDKDHASVFVRTPIGSFPTGPLTATSSSSLWSVVYPKSEWSEENNIDFYNGTTGNEEKVAQLTVLRFHTNLPLTQMDDWYRQRLGQSFARIKGWSPEGNEQGKEVWLQSVRSDADPEALVYQETTPDRVRGVMLQGQPDSNGVMATLYEFQEGRR